MLLAAGSATRFGSDKRRALLPDGRTLLQTTLDVIGKTGLPLLVCLQAEDAALAEELTGRGVHGVCCRRAGEGMGSTLAEGILSAPTGWNGVLVALADMAWVRPSTYSTIARALSAATIVQPEWRGTPGHPVGFGRQWFGDLAVLSGPRGARSVLDAYPDQLRSLPVDDPGILADVDTPEQLRSLGSE